MRAITSQELNVLAEKCLDISDDVADSEGFVPIRHLTEQFDAELILRPLLVEGMLASIENDPFQNNSSTHQWAVMVDNETYPHITEESISVENTWTPLPARMRNTIAHELVHSFAFRGTEFGVELTKRNSKWKNRREFIEAIEKETEKLSPLLLIPYGYIEKQLTNSKSKLSIFDIQAVYRRMGVSRYVFINRMNLLKLIDKKELLSRPSLRNIAIGIGERLGDNKVKLKEWPLFINFDRNIIPDFLIMLLKGKLRNIIDYIDDPSFIFCGGEETYLKTVVKAGTIQTPSAENMNISCFVESNSRKKGTEFLFLINAESKSREQ